MKTYVIETENLVREYKGQRVVDRLNMHVPESYVTMPARRVPRCEL